MTTYHLAGRLVNDKLKCCGKRPFDLDSEVNTLVPSWEFVPPGNQICGGPSPEQVKAYNELPDEDEAE